jgi:signal transduction histidine kinase
MGIRLRTTLTTTTLAALALVVGALLFAGAIRDRIEAAIAEDARERALEIAALAVAGQLSPVLAAGDPELIAQVVDSEGHVLSSDQVIVGLPPMSDFDPTGPAMEVVRVDQLAGGQAAADDEGPFVVAIRRLDQGASPQAVLVVGSLGDAAEALDAAAPLLFAGVPALVALVGVLTWIMTGQALQPVERIRAEAHNISASALDKRVPVPDSRDEIHRLAVTINEMLQRLETSVVRQRQFVSDSSHELKSPLAALRTILEVAERDGQPASPDVLTDLQSEVDRLERLVEDLLYLAAFDEGRPKRSFVEVSLDQIVRDEIASVSRSRQLLIDSSDLAPVRILGDPHQLSRLVRNLTENAVRFAHTGIWIATEEVDSSALLTVSDDGPGVPLADRSRVFDRFVRLDESRNRQSGGAGLGLAVTAAIVSAHGGELAIIDSLHGGASFQVRLPKTESPKTPVLG